MQATAGNRPDLRAEMNGSIGRYEDKRFDWEAFPASAGFPDLDRCQMRYIGAGGSDKVDDPTTLEPGHFTLSIVQQPPGKYAASHSHECVESFLALGGILTVGWAWGDEVLEARLGPKDMCLNAIGRPHGFRNDGDTPVYSSIMVGSKAPLPPRYVCHPRDTEAAMARAFGAAPGKTHKLQTDSEDHRHREFARHIVRYRDRKPDWHAAGFAKLAYIGEGGAPAGSYRMDLVHLPRSAGVALYERQVEDVYFVLEGVITVGWEEQGRVHEERLGPKDLVFNPPGRAHYFRNDGVTDAQFMLAVGTPKPEDVIFKAA